MGRKPCCAKEGLNRGAWTAIEDKLLTNYINVHGEGKWRDLPLRAGLKRCGKSCRLRWLNYLRSDIKRGNISEEEEDLIIKLHKLLGNRWSLIAGRLPGRTDNEIKNYWNTNLSKRMQLQERRQRLKTQKRSIAEPHEVIRTKAVRCTKAVDVPQEKRPDRTESASANGDTVVDDPFDFLMDLNVNDLLVSDVIDSEFHRSSSSNENDDNNIAGGGALDICSGYGFPFPDYEVIMQRNSADEETILPENWNGSDLLQPHEASELETLESLLDSGEEWIC